jgi:hypothetical protein
MQSSAAELAQSLLFLPTYHPAKHQAPTYVARDFVFFLRNWRQGVFWGEIILGFAKGFFASDCSGRLPALCVSNITTQLLLANNVLQHIGVSQRSQEIFLCRATSLAEGALCDPEWQAKARYRGNLEHRGRSTLGPHQQDPLRQREWDEHRCHWGGDRYHRADEG